MSGQIVVDVGIGHVEIDRYVNLGTTSRVDIMTIETHTGVVVHEIVATASADRTGLSGRFLMNRWGLCCAVDVKYNARHDTTTSTLATSVCSRRGGLSARANCINREHGLRGHLRMKRELIVSGCG